MSRFLNRIQYFHQEANSTMSQAHFKNRRICVKNCYVRADFYKLFRINLQPP